LLKASKDTDYTVVTECTTALSNYAERAEGKGWEAYKRLYKARGFCFAQEYHYKDREKNIIDMFFYDPNDINAYFSNFDWKRRPTNEVRKVLDAYYAHGGQADQQTLLMETSYKIRTGNTFKEKDCKY